MCCASGIARAENRRLKNKPNHRGLWRRPRQIAGAAISVCCHPRRGDRSLEVLADPLVTATANFFCPPDFCFFLFLPLDDCAQLPDHPELGYIARLRSFGLVKVYHSRIFLLFPVSVDFKYGVPSASAKHPSAKHSLEQMALLYVVLDYSRVCTSVHDLEEVGPGTRFQIVI